MKKMMKLCKCGLKLLLIWGLLVSIPVAALAATGYEVPSSSVNFSDTVTAAQYVRLTADLTVSWNAPTASGQVDPDNVMNYYLKFTTSNTVLTDQQLNDTTNDFAVASPLDSKTIPLSFFSSYDVGVDRYLHIKTQYASPTGGYAFSDDVVVGPIRIDNVAPSGTITLDPTSGSSTQVTVTVSPSEPIQYFWLSESPNFPGGTGFDGNATSREWTVLASSYGTVPIYAWFQDYAGNRSSSATATANYDFTAPVSIQYNTAPIEVDGARDFAIVGTSETYTWTITDPSVTGVAEFSGPATGVASVTVIGKEAGTFILSATPTAGGSVLTTGTITVVQTATPGDIDNDGAIALTDVRLAFRFFLGIQQATSQQFTSANCYDDGDGGATITLHDVRGVFRLFLGIGL